MCVCVCVCVCVCITQRTWVQPQSHRMDFKSNALRKGSRVDACSFVVIVR
jgi:hypothetical protein